MLGREGAGESGLSVAATGSSFRTSVHKDLFMCGLLKGGELGIAIKMEALPWAHPYFNRNQCVKVESTLV